MRRVRRAAPRPGVLAGILGAALVAALVAATGWSEDDGRTVREFASTDATPSASPSASRADADDLLALGLARYRDEVLAGLDESIAAVDALGTAAASADRAAAQAGFGGSRAGWLRALPLAARHGELVAVIDGSADGAASQGPDATTGWPAIERALWGDDVTEAASLAARLGADLAAIRNRVATTTVTTRDVVAGARALAGTLEARAVAPPSPSATAWWDIANGLAGLDAALGTLTPALQEHHSALVAALDALLADATTAVEPYRDGSGWRPFTAAPDSLRATLAELGRRLWVVGVALGTG